MIFLNKQNSSFSHLNFLIIITIKKILVDFATPGYQFATHDLLAHLKLSSLIFSLKRYSTFYDQQIS